MDQYQHDDKCRWWDDGEFCTCGAIEIDRLEKELAAAKEEIARLKKDNASDQSAVMDQMDEMYAPHLVRLKTALASERKETERLREALERIMLTPVLRKGGYEMRKIAVAALQSLQGEE